MYCAKCKEPIRDGVSTCPYCGATQPTMQPNAPQPQFRQAPQNRPQAPAELPASYIAVSWLTFAAFLIYGILKGISGLNNGIDVQIYKAFVICLAACVFIPQIRIKSLDNMPWVVYLVKFVAALAISVIL